MVSPLFKNYGATMNPTPETRYRASGLVRQEVRLSPDDTKKLSSLRDHIKEALGLKPSVSILASMALAALADEIAKGRLRSHPSLQAAR